MQQLERNARTARERLDEQTRAQFIGNERRGDVRDQASLATGVAQWAEDGPPTEQGFEGLLSNHAASDPTRRPRPSALSCRGNGGAVAERGCYDAFASRVRPVAPGSIEAIIFRRRVARPHMS